MWDVCYPYSRAQQVICILVRHLESLPGDETWHTWLLELSPIVHIYAQYYTWMYQWEMHFGRENTYMHVPYMSTITHFQSVGREEVIPAVFSSVAERASLFPTLQWDTPSQMCYPVKKPELIIEYEERTSIFQKFDTSNALSRAMWSLRDSSAKVLFFSSASSCLCCKKKKEWKKHSNF